MLTPKRTVLSAALVAGLTLATISAASARMPANHHAFTFSRSGSQGPGPVIFGPAPAHLIIVPTFGASITGSPDDAAIELAINRAINQLEQHILTPITVNITFESVGFGLGTSSTAVNTIGYTAYRSDVKNEMGLSAFDRQALKSLGKGSSNPVNHDGTLQLTLPLLRAIGEPKFGNNGGQEDSTISLNTGLCNLSREGAQDPNKYDLQQVALHEICEVLGAGGGGSVLPTLDGPVGVLDLYRYKGRKKRSFTTDTGEHAYFSIDSGATKRGFFDQSGEGDYADWDSELNGFPQVQDAASTPNIQLDLDVNEWISLDVVGHTLRPDAFIEDLQDEVAALGLSKGDQSVLSGDLGEALSDLEAGHRAKVVKRLKTFEKHVKNFRRRNTLSTEQAAPLTARAELLVAIL